MFKKICACGISGKTFKKDIGPFFIAECCEKAGYDIYGKKKVGEEREQEVKPRVIGKPFGDSGLIKVEPGRMEYDSEEAFSQANLERMGKEIKERLVSSELSKYLENTPPKEIAENITKQKTPAELSSLNPKEWTGTFAVPNPERDAQWYLTNAPESFTIKQLMDYMTSLGIKYVMKDNKTKLLDKLSNAVKGSLQT